MRKTITVLMIAVFTIMLASCSGKSEKAEAAGETETANEAEAADEAEATAEAETAGEAGEENSNEALFQTVCSADEALELAKNAGAVVFERQGCTSGKDVWDTFYHDASDGSAASVLCAHYYVLEKEHMSEELYEQEKDKYPKLFFYLVAYDGKEYSIKVRESTLETLDYKDTFQYLLHFTGEAPPTALYTDYDNYVLVDDPEATWDGIVAGMVSSQAGAGYKHFTVYLDYIGWNG